MAPLARLLWLVPLLALVVCGSLASGDPATAPARTVEGIATTSAGKPLAHVTLYLFGLPPGETDMITLGDQSTVVTDDHGRFTWAVPAALPPLSDYIGVRSIACYALAADRSRVQYRLALRGNEHGTDADQGTRSLLEQATQPCETKWQTPDTHPVFSVVVPNTSAVDLVVRGLDGTPLREREIEVVPGEPPSVYGGAVVYTGRTDAEGRLPLRCFPGSLSLQVFVPGLGFGATGAIDAVAGQTAVPQLPPLAPFAALSGTLAPALAGPGAAIHLQDFSFGNDWYDPPAVVDMKGQWVMADVLPGQHRLILTGGRGESEPVTVTVLPDGQVSGIAIGPQKPVAGTETGGPAPEETTVSVRGQVTDAEGRPAAGADVYAVCSASEGGVFRSRGRGQQVLSVKTDAAGEYVFSGLPVGDGQRGPLVHLVASRPGFGLAVGDGKSEKDSLSGRWGDIRSDLVLPASHSGLTVRVLQGGKPCPNVLVALAAQGDNTVVPEMYSEADRGEAAQTLRRMLAPSGQTGLDGVVRFTDLSPGLWDVTANRTPYSYSPPGSAVPPFNTSTGVAVQAGTQQTFTLSLLPTPGAVVFRVLGPNGASPSVERDVVTLKTADNPNYGGLELTPDSAGNGQGRFVVPGLFQVTARFGDKPLDTNALAGPYFEGASWVAVSAATGSSRPVTLSTQQIGPARLRVRLQDAHGKPLRGTVTVGDPFNSALYAATVNAEGEAVFHNMPQNFFKYTVTARFTDLPVTAWPARQDGLVPSDAALLAGINQPPPQVVGVRSGEETLVTFGPKPPGYVRLRLTGPLASAKGYWMDARLPTDDAFVPTRFDPATNEYLFGPLPAGSRRFDLSRYVGGAVATNLNAGGINLVVKSGQIVHAAVVAQSTALQEWLYSASLLGTVYLADGKTPAWGARAALFVPDWSVPRLMARTDTQGRLVVNDYWRSPARPKELPGTPAVPVVAAWLPGASGAVIVPFQPGQDMRLVLPPAISLHGRVTVGGQPVSGLPSQFRVLAAYRGKGRLNEALSVEATAQADGTFTLAGLTPGTYQVQAARDNIWLSETQTITVSGEALPEMTLDIAPPGAPVLLSLADKQGKPRPGQEVEIVRPDGPLTEEIWPARLTTDSRGRLRVDGVEAGHHRMTVEGQPNVSKGQPNVSIGFDVPVWTPSVPLTTRRVVLPLEPRAGTKLVKRL